MNAVSFNFSGGMTNATPSRRRHRTSTSVRVHTHKQKPETTDPPRQRFLPHDRIANARRRRSHRHGPQASRATPAEPAGPALSRTTRRAVRDRRVSVRSRTIQMELAGFDSSSGHLRPFRRERPQIITRLVADSGKLAAAATLFLRRT